MKAAKRIVQKRRSVESGILILGLWLWCICMLSPTVILAGQSASGQPDAYESLYWNSVQDSNNIEMYRAYLKRYPAGAFADLAQIKIKECELNYWKMVNESNDISMFREYIRRYPAGAFADLAQIKINALEQAPSSAKAGSKQAGAGKPEAQLRATPRKLEEKEIQATIQQYNFYDQKRNPNGDYKNAFVDNKNDTITDKKTGLIWEKKGSWRKVGRKKADRYIEDLNQQKFAGRSDWRLPTLPELESLVEASNTKGNWLYIDPMFGDPAGDWIDICWSADEKAPSYTNKFGAWLVSFKQGTVKESDWTDENHVAGVYKRNEFNYVRAVCSEK